MLFHIIIWLTKTIQSNTFIVHDMYNIMSKDIADFQSDQRLNDNDYEMINTDLMNTFNKEDKFNLYQLNKLASQEYEKTLKSMRIDVNALDVKGSGVKSKITEEIDNNIVTPDMIPVTKYTITKRNAVNNDYYNYDRLLGEYYLEAIEDTQSNKTYNTSKNGHHEYGFLNSIKKIVSFEIITRNCSEEELNQIGLQAIQCLVNEYRTQRMSSQILAKRLWRIIKIWWLVYLIVAVPLWCTRGWCCCCLFCKFFKPGKTIDAAKRYLVLHPPGIMKTKGGIIRYEPTQREKEIYEEFEHFIRTL